MAAGQIFKGRDLRIKVGDKTLYHATNCQLTVATTTEELATKDTNGTIVTPDGYTSSLSTDSLWADKLEASSTQLDPLDLLQHQLDEDLLTFEFSSYVNGERTISGNCYVTNTDLGAEVGSSATASFQFTVSGDIDIEVISE